jgi:hypothetical protein
MAKNQASDARIELNLLQSISADEAEARAILPNDKTEKHGGTLCQVNGLNQTKTE